MVIDEITKIYIEREDIIKIVNKLKGIRFEDLKKSDYYGFSLLKILLVKTVFFDQQL